MSRLKGRRPTTAFRGRQRSVNHLWWLLVPMPRAETRAALRTAGRARRSMANALADPRRRVVTAGNLVAVGVEQVVGTVGGIFD